MYAFDPLATAPSGMTDACASQHQQHQQLSPTDPTPAVMATSAGLALTLAPPAGASGRHDGIGPVVSRNEHGVHGEGVGSTSTGHSYSGIFMDTPHQVRDGGIPGGGGGQGRGQVLLFVLGLSFEINWRAFAGRKV